MEPGRRAARCGPGLSRRLRVVPSVPWTNGRCRQMIVAIDGPAGSGKSTVARGVARRLGFTYLDSGAMYRAVTLLALEAGSRPRRRRGARAGSPQDATIELRERDHDYVQVLLDGRDVSEEIRAPRVTGASSTVAAHPRRARRAARQAARADRRGRLRGRGTRHRHRRRPRRAGQGVPDRRSGGAGAAAAPAELERRGMQAQAGRGAGARSSSATGSTRPARRRRCARPTTRSRSTPPA